MGWARVMFMVLHELEERKTSRQGEDFNKLVELYKQTDEKPDKQFSILPTVLSLVGNPHGRTVLDLGCGGGFFARRIAEKGAHRVIGIDTSKMQLQIARQKARSNTEYSLGNIFTDQLPKADIALAAFVLNYAQSPDELKKLIAKVHDSLAGGGKAVFVIDLPESSSSVSYKVRRRWGAVKKWGIVETGEVAAPPIKNMLFSKTGIHLCSLWAFYFEPLAVQFALQEAGFREIRWHRPIIAQEGIQQYGETFWKGYIEHCELGYVTTYK